MKSSAEISQQISDLENALKTAIQAKGTVKQVYLNKQREKLNLQIELKDLDIALDKAEENIKVLKIDLAQAKDLFWSARNSGV